MRGRKRLFRAAIGVAAAAALGAGGYALADSTTVQLTPTGPQPPSVTVSWGDTVTFQNADSQPVTIVSGHTDFGSSNIPPGGTYQKVFNGKVGTYLYRATKTKPKGGIIATHGAVVVKMTAQLSLVAKPAAAVYPRPVTLQGTTTLAGQPVTLQQKAVGVKEWSPLADVTPGPDGTYSFVVKPLGKTSFRATQADGQLASATVTVRVTPKVTMSVTPRNAQAGARITVAARVQPASAASAVLLLSSVGHGWKQIAKATLHKDGSAKFSFTLAAGTLSLRAIVKPPVLHQGFEVAQSPDVRLSGANPPSTLAFRIYTPPSRGKHASAPDLFSTHALRATAGRVTLILKNLGKGRHGLAISGRGMLRKGPVVGHGGTSKVTATLAAGVYTFYSYVGDDRKRGEVGRLVVAP